MTTDELERRYKAFTRVSPDMVTQASTNEWDRLCGDLLAALCERDETIKELKFRLQALAFAEAEYRDAYVSYGDGSHESGYRWDQMRKAGDRARGVLTQKADDGKTFDNAEDFIRDLRDDDGERG